MEKNNTVLRKLSIKLSQLWKRSYCSSFFFHDDGKNVDNSFIIGKVKKIPTRKYVFEPLKSVVSKSFDKSFFVEKLISLFEYMLSLSLRCYGWSIVTFIFVSVFLKALNHSFSENTALGLLIVLISVFPTLFSSKTLSSALYKSKLFSLLIVNLLDCEKLEVYSKVKPRGNSSGAIIVGFISSFFTLVFSYEQILFFLLLLILTFVFLCRPETAVLTVSISFAFLDSKEGIYLSVIALLSYLVKVLRGKRSFHISLYDLSPMLFIVLFLIIQSKNDFSFAAIIAPLLYFAFSGLLKSGELLYKSVKNISISITFLAIYKIISFFMTENVSDYKLFFRSILKRNVLFDTNESVSLLYGCAFVILVCFLVFEKRNKGAILGGIIINFFALCLCGSDFTALGCVLSIMIFSIILSKNKIVVISLSTAFIFAIFKVLSFFSNNTDSIDNSIKLAKEYKDYLWFGIENYNLIYTSDSVSNMGNLWIHLSLWGGLIAFITIFASLIVFFRNGITSGSYSQSMRIKSISISVGCSTLVYLISSIGCFSWNDTRVFALFWIIGGISSAIRNHYILEKSVLETSELY